MRPLPLVAVVLALGLGGFPAALAAQGGDRSYGYLLLVGSDTVGVERITVVDKRWSGEVVARGQGPLLWSAVHDSSGFFGPLELTAFRTATDSLPFQRVVLAPTGDSVLMTRQVPAGPPSRLASRPGAFVLLNTSLGMLEVLAERAAVGGQATVPAFLAAGGQTLDAVVRRWRDSASLAIAGQLTRLTLDARGRVSGGSVPSQNLRFVRLEGAALAAIALGAPDYGAPAGVPYTALPVRIPTRAGHELAATLTRPAPAAGRVPVVITISGSGPQDRDERIVGVSDYRPFRQLADTLGRRGIAVLRFDDRGYGASTGDHASATSADFASDVTELVAWLRARPDVDPDRIFLLGHSEGGLIAPLVAATDKRIAGLVLLAGPGKTGREIIFGQQRYAIEHDSGFRTPAARDSATAQARGAYDSLAASSPWFRYFSSYDPLPAARRVTAPVLILQGETDRQITADQAERLGGGFRAGGNRDVTVRVLPGLNHLFLADPDGNPAHYGRLSGRIGPEVLGLIAEWVVGHSAR